jgi:hypothetical protein
MCSRLPAIRHSASNANDALDNGHVYSRCHVKPEASKQREGTVSVTDSANGICVSARQRDGEASKAMKELCSRVRSLKCFWSIVEYSRYSSARNPMS